MIIARTLKTNIAMALALTGLATIAVAIASAPVHAQSRTREYYDRPSREITDDDVRRMSIDNRDDNREQSGEDDDDNRSRDGGLDDGDDAPDVSYFYEELENDGRWISHSDYGYVWAPHRIDADWRPYTRGHWVNTEEYGWYWVSEESFGWATFHYGRWHLDDRHGWVWVPGTRWGPAWVAWRSGDRHIGWAPLPPDAYWEPLRRRVVYEETIYEGPRFSAYWSFVEPTYISTPGLWRHCASRDRVTYMVRETRPSTRYVFINQRIVNRGVEARHIERVTRQPVVTHRIAAANGRNALSAPVQDGDAIKVFQPDLSRRAVAERRKGRPSVQWGGAPNAVPPATGALPPRQKTATPVVRAGRANAFVWRDVDRQRGKGAKPVALPGATNPANAAPTGPRPDPRDDNQPGPLPPLPDTTATSPPPNMKPAPTPGMVSPPRGRDRVDGERNVRRTPPQNGLTPPAQRTRPPERDVRRAPQQIPGFAQPPRGRARDGDDSERSVRDLRQPQDKRAQRELRNARPYVIPNRQNPAAAFGAPPRPERRPAKPRPDAGASVEDASEQAPVRPN